jgi:TonB family protein
MDSLFSQRPFRKRRLFFAFVMAILLEGSLVLVAAIWPAQKSWTIPPTVTQLDTGPVLGETVQELIAPKEEPVPTPDQAPTPPPEDTPPPDDTPPPTDDPDMEPPPPPKKEAPKPASKAIPPNAKRGDHPQAGVVGGVPHAEKTTGTPGYAHLGSIAHWSHPKPPYPAQARMSHIEGSGSVRVTTDGSGNVVSAVIVQSVGSGLLDFNTTSFAKANWKGPPNSTVVVPITYRLQ